MEDVPDWALAIAGAFLVAMLVEHNPKIGGGVLLCVTLGIMLSATQKGMA